MVKNIKTKCKNINLYEIEFSDLSYIKNLSEDCFGIIKEFCGTSYYGDMLHYDVHEFFSIARKYGIYDMIEQIFVKKNKRYNKRNFIQQNYYDFHRAIKYGHLEVLVWMKSEFPDLINDAFKSDDYYGFSQVCENGHLKVLVWMKNEFPNLINNAFKSKSDVGFYWASENGHLKVLIWMKNNFPDLINNTFRSYYCGNFWTLHMNGYLKVIDWIKTEFNDMIKE